MVAEKYIIWVQISFNPEYAAWRLCTVFLAEVGFEPTSLGHEPSKEPLLYSASYQDTFLIVALPFELLLHNVVEKMGLEPITHGS